jgi:hypothetical protein
MTEKAVWHIVKEAASCVGVAKLAPHDLRRYAVIGMSDELVLGSATPLGASWNRFSSSWVTFRFRPLNAISAVSREFDPRSMIESVSSRLLRLDKTFRKACRQVAK